MDDNQVEKKEVEGRRIPLWIIVGGCGFALLLGLLFTLSMIPPVKDPGQNQQGAGETGDGKGESGLSNLASQPDDENCRSFLNGFASKIAKLQVGEPVLPPALGPVLDAAQKTEWGQKSPTKLDTRHLVEAFFFRDIASRLAGTTDLWAGLCPEKSLRKSARLMNWVCRQVSMLEPGMAIDPVLANPSLILKRGWGTGLDRALVFLFLWDQAAGTQSVPPILFAMPGVEPGRVRHLVGVWSQEIKDFWLLDPELGLPLELVSPNWAWLGGIRRNPEKAVPLKAGNFEWDLKAENLAQGQCFLVRTLSGLSPRLEATQTILQQNGINVFLGQNPAKDLADLEKSLELAGWPKNSSGTRVTLWKPALGLLRDFTSVDEGGTDQKDARMDGFKLTAVPLAAMPPALRIDFQLGGNQKLLAGGPWLVQFATWDAGLKEIVPFQVAERFTSLFSAPFLVSTFQANQTRDMLLRGKWNKLTSNLVGEQDDLKKAQRAYESTRVVIEKQLGEWVTAMEQLYAAENRAKRGTNAAEISEITKRINEAWKAETTGAILANALSRSRGVEIAYFLALIRQEEAEKMVPGKVQNDRLASAWEESASAWKRFNEDLSPGLCVGVARTCWAEAVYQAGDPTRALSILDANLKTLSNHQKKVIAFKADVLRRLGAKK